MVPWEETALSKNTTTDNGIMAQQNTGNDNARTDTRDEDDTPGTLQRNDTTKTKDTGAMGKQGQCLTGKTQQQGKQENTKETEYAKKQGKTGIMQLGRTNPEMPDEMELNRENRKQLAELMLEYPTDTSKRRGDQTKENPKNRDITRA